MLKITQKRAKILQILAYSSIGEDTDHIKSLFDEGHSTIADELKMLKAQKLVGQFKTGDGKYIWSISADGKEALKYYKQLKVAE